MNLRCRGPLGQTTLSGLDTSMTVAQFQALLGEKTGVEPAIQEILTGFPPTTLQLPDVGSQPLSSLPLRPGDTILVRRGECRGQQAPAPATSPPEAPATAVVSPTRQPLAAIAPSGPVAAAPPGMTGVTAVPAATAGPQSWQADSAEALDDDEQYARALAASLNDAYLAEQTLPERPNGHAISDSQSSVSAQRPHLSAAQQQQRQPPAAARPSTSAAQQGAPSYVVLPDGTAVSRRIIESDNSCLFNAVGYVMEGSRQQAGKLRRVIADAVAADPETYSEAFLGKPNAEYCSWILRPDKWGGAIELSILAEHYGREIAAYDVQTRRCDVYGQGRGHPERAMLIYDGLHYDALALTAFEGGPEEVDQTIFEREGPAAAVVFRGAAELVAKCHEARQFTDTSSFTLRCGVCQIGVRGEKEAMQHAKATGHQSFSEYH